VVDRAGIGPVFAMIAATAASQAVGVCRVSGRASDTAGFDRPAALTFSRQFDIAVDFDLEIDAADRNDRPRG
jgi:hypothetical protein